MKASYDIEQRSQSRHRIMILDVPNATLYQSYYYRDIHCIWFLVTGLYNIFHVQKEILK